MPDTKRDLEFGVARVAGPLGLMYNYNMKTFISVLFFTVSNLCWSQTHVQINGISLHDQSGYNGFNYGMGFEQAVAEQFSVAAGW